MNKKSKTVATFELKEFEDGLLIAKVSDADGLDITDKFSPVVIEVDGADFTESLNRFVHTYGAKLS